jgi:hypothetical protein
MTPPIVEVSNPIVLAQRGVQRRVLHRRDAVRLGLLEKHCHRDLLQTPDVVARLGLKGGHLGLALSHRCAPDRCKP